MRYAAKVMNIEALRELYRMLPSESLVRSDMLLVLADLEDARKALEIASAECGQSAEGWVIDDRTPEQVVADFAKDGVTFRYV